VVYPVNPNSMINIVVVAVSIIIVFELFRKIKIPAGKKNEDQP
jgi:hypothetical protein